MRQTGTLTQWDDAKGYGFIQPDTPASERCFVHASAFGLRPRRPFVGERLSFELGRNDQGRRRALQVLSLEPRRGAEVAKPVNKPIKPATSSGGVWLVPAFATLLLAADSLWGLPRGLIGLYLALSLAAFIVYADDKRAARRQAPRVAESTLHLLALAGGWPGALLAQQVLRHKSVKRTFRRWFWASVLLNIAVFALVCTPLGHVVLRLSGLNAAFI